MLVLSKLRPGRNNKFRVAPVSTFEQGQLLVSEQVEVKRPQGAWQPASETWQSILDQAIVLGFFFLALGISTGAAWAYEAWGTYWAWDPKETWALVTWMVFGLALHARFQRRLGLERGLTVFGYLCLWFTYMGVTYILPGLHSYT